MQALVLLLCAMVPLDPAKDEDAKELAKLEGVWKPTAVVSSGRELQLQGLPSLDRYTLVVVGDHYVFSTHGGTVKLDPAKGAIDLAVTEGRYKGTTGLGLYELKGDTLRLALRSNPSAAGGRPADLKSAAGSGYYSYTFEREKATKEQVAARLKDLTTPLAAQAQFGVIRGAVIANGAAPAASTAQMLRQIIEQLDRIEKRLDALEKKAAQEKK